MKSRFIVAFAAASFSAVLAISLPVLSAQQDEEPCCNVRSINARTKMVTITENKTGCTYEVQVNDAKNLAGLKTGASLVIDVKALVPQSGPTGSTGQAASGTGTGPCGSNVARNANTKPTGGKCYRIEAGGKMVEEPCRK